MRTVKHHRTTTGPDSAEKAQKDLAFLLFIAASIAGLVQLSSPVPFGAGFEMIAIAKSLAANGTFANPFYVANTGPTAANPPLYPALLALVFKILRNDAAVAIVATIGNILANAATAALLPSLSRVFYGDPRPGVVASVLWLFGVQLMPSWDVGLTVLGLVAFCLFSTSPAAAKRPIQHGGLMGGLLGCLALSNPSTLLITTPWVVYLASRRKSAWLTTAKYCCTILALALLISSGWMLRNRVAVGAFVLRINLGVALNASLNDCAEATLLATEVNGCFQRHHPNANISEAVVLRSIGEPRYDAVRIETARQWAISHPARFRSLTVERFREFWFPWVGQPPLSRLAIGLVTALSVPGLLLMIWRRQAVVVFMMAALAAYPVMYYLVVSDVRYRYPVLWISSLTAGHAVCWAIAWIRKKGAVKISQ
jgi:hypothetical protein